MPEELLVRCCAPTLASIKTGNLFTCHSDDRETLWQSVRELNSRLRQKGLRVVPMRHQDGVGLVYVYRPEKLRLDLLSEIARELLSERGYPVEDENRCVARLRERLNEQAAFPHEIGLFLGYPPEDVAGFIHQKEEAKASGLWKVYHDVEAAERTFAKYRKCTDVYLRHWANGSRLERLTVRSY